MKFTKKISATWQYYKNLSFTVPLDLYNEDILRISLKRSFEKYNFCSPHNEIMSEDIITGAIQEAKGLSESTSLEQISSSFSHIIADIVQKASLTCGVAGMWEMNLKFFAGKLDEVSVLEKIKNQNKLRTTNVSKISNEISDFYPNIKSNLNFIATLRNNLFHGNFHQLRADLESVLTPEQIKELKSNIAVVPMGSNKKIRMSDEISEIEDAKQMGVFFWFFSAGNSKLLDYTIEIISKSINDVGALSTIHANSFNETNNHFNILAKEGRKWNKSEERIFLEKRKTTLPWDKERPQQTLDYIYSLFNL